MKSETVRIPGSISLAGTLQYPDSWDSSLGLTSSGSVGQETANTASEQKIPAVLFIHGSGPVDRDENMKGPIKLNVFNQLADWFSAMGLASLRYDKRGTGSSEGSFMEAGRQDLLNDALQALHWLKARPELDPNRIFIVGHSEGALLAPALFRLEAAAGLVLLAGAAGDFKATLEWQSDNLIASLEASKGFQGWVIRRFKLGNKLKKDQAATFNKIDTSSQPVLRYKGRKINAGWFRDHFVHSCDQDLPHVSCPVLAVTGSKDVQVKPGDAAVLAGLCAGPAESVIIDQMTHILRIEDKASQPLDILKNYRKSGRQALAPQLQQVLADWFAKYC
ncbi:MAG: lysophospholipase [Spirochaetes bacterium]|nr:lysophospholipase [Spirochaetota bacterium]MBU0956436.1 lysophospholipase [Spirochaetota bacterium]